MSHGYDEDRSEMDNIARALFDIADAIDGLLYAFKYSKAEGTSVAEAIENAGKTIGEKVSYAIRDVSEAMINK